MIKTYTMTRADLKAKDYKRIQRLKEGAAPTKRNDADLIRVLKKAIQQ